MPEVITTTDKPILQEALASTKLQQWLQKMQKEFENLQCNGTWKLDTPPPGVRPLPSEIILKLKRDSSRRPVRLKERVFPRGKFQFYSVYYL